MSDESNVSQLPGNIVFNLDEVERPAEDIKPPFVFAFKGRELRMEDPAELDWRDLLLMDDPTQFIKLALAKDDRKWLYDQGFESWRFGKLIEAYSNHFDLEGQMRKARQQARLAEA